MGHLFGPSYVVTIRFQCCISGKVFHLTNIYGQCDAEVKFDFINWLYNFYTSAIEGWILVGDFNLIRSLEDQNKPGANMNDMLLFNI